MVPYPAGSPPSFPRTQQTVAAVRAAWEAPALGIASAGGWFAYMRDDFLPRMFPERWYNGQAIGEQGWTGVLEIRGLRAVGEIFVRQAPAAPPRPVRAAAGGSACGSCAGVRMRRVGLIGLRGRERTGAGGDGRELREGVG